MADLKESAYSILSTTDSVDMKTASTKRTLYTVPTGKIAIITAVVVRNPSASLAGGTSYSFGDSATGTGWKSSVDLSSMTTATTDVFEVLPAAKYSTSIAAAVFGMYITTGSTAAATASIDVIGYLIDA